MKRVSIHILSLLLAAVLTMGVLGFAPKTQAASYQGSGTVTDPYLVTTADELSDMRKNLTAHYKLAATIDLSAIKNFKPIGTIGKPFTGSFTCPLNSDGQPMYAILNLNIHTAEGPYIDYGISRWEAALFGGIENASLSNILLINATIKNDNIGDHRGAVVYGDYKPGMDEMPTAPLAGYAINSTINNCGATGVVDANSNGCAGLVSWVEGGSVTNCWSTVNVKSFGKWNQAGLISVAKNSAIVANCWASGTVENGLFVRGALIASTEDVVIQNCYATGDAAEGFVARATNTTFSNCYYTGNSVNAPTQTGSTASNCFVLTGKPAVMDGFTSASEADIKNAFAKVKGWDTSGTLPVLTDVKAPADLSAYKVGTAVVAPGDTPVPTTPATQPTTPATQPTTPATQPTTSGTQPTTPGTQPTTSGTQPTTPGTQPTTAGTQPSTPETQPTTPGTQPSTPETQPTTPATTPETQPSTPETQPSTPETQPTTPMTQPTETEENPGIISLEELLAIIEELPIVENITLEHKDNIKKAVDAVEIYAEEGEVEPIQHKKVIDSYKAVQALMVADLGTRIDNLPDPQDVTQDHKEEVEAIVSDMDFLNDTYKAFIAEELHIKLKQVQEALANAPEPTETAAAYTTGEILVLVILAVIILLNATTNIIITLILFKKKKKETV